MNHALLSKGFSTSRQLFQQIASCSLHPYSPCWSGNREQKILETWFKDLVLNQMESVTAADGIPLSQLSHPLPQKVRKVRNTFTSPSLYSIILSPMTRNNKGSLETLSASSPLVPSVRLLPCILYLHSVDRGTSASMSDHLAKLPASVKYH